MPTQKPSKVKIKVEYGFTLLPDIRCSHSWTDHPGIKGVRICSVCNKAEQKEDEK